MSSAHLTADRDTITDFNAVQDQLVIAASVFGGGLVAGEVLGSKFLAVSGGVATGSEDRFVYDTSNGRLYFDADGSASPARVLIATLTGSPTLSDLDFTILA